ncbi:response regulator transcription factor [Marinicella sp. S1101]|uniref:response regulator transcription factor n=1 Tax=Marinicella marina TaxID=2996016 RepID=UPI002260BBF7|nr:response regulator transcription factor [Marinicella marina]MCX7553995.1 response regulator transcription factor [Marinicella marina]MDJ1140487.1 response regulator transcription factor [Marinicella marina]
MIRLLIAEDQALLLSTLATLLNLETDVHVVHQAANGKEALDYIMDENNDAVDLVLTDIEMPHMTGIELAQAIQKQKPEINVIILTTFSRAGYLRRAMDAGVKGYLLKDSPSDELLAAIRKVANGGKVIAPELLQDAWMKQDPLTDKEIKALRLAKEGKSTEQIAKTLHLTSGTIRNYLSSACSKLNAKNRVEAARIAHQKGWL